MFGVLVLCRIRALRLGGTSICLDAAAIPLRHPQKSLSSSMWKEKGGV